MMMLFVLALFAGVTLMFGARIAIRNWMGGPQDGSNAAERFVGVMDAPSLTDEERQKLRMKAKEKLLS